MCNLKNRSDVDDSMDNILNRIRDLYERAWKEGNDGAEHLADVYLRDWCRSDELHGYK